jgi:hypothetical protein
MSNLNDDIRITKPSIEAHGLMENPWIQVKEGFMDASWLHNR